MQLTLDPELQVQRYLTAALSTGTQHTVAQHSRLKTIKTETAALKAASNLKKNYIAVDTHIHVEQEQNNHSGNLQTQAGKHPINHHRFNKLTPQSISSGGFFRTGL